MVFCSGFSSAQVNRYMVFFGDKNGTPYTTTNASAFLSSRALERRLNQGITVNETDLPVNPVYITSVANTGATVLYPTKWMNGILVACDASLVSTIAAIPEVSTVEFVAPGAPANGGRQKSVKQRMGTNDEATSGQLSMLGIPEMHADGFRGEGITIAVFDGGFLGANAASGFAHIFDDNRYNVNASFNYVKRNHDVFQTNDHGTRVFSLVGGFLDGQFTSGSYKANFQLYVTEDVSSEYRVEEYFWLFAAERADSAGVDIINSSLGYNIFDNPSMDYMPAQMDGQTAVVTRAAQYAADKGMVVVTSAGNEGLDSSWRIVTAPADAEDALAVGSITAAGVKSPTSSIGPTSDDRIKPDVVAQGVGTTVIRANGDVVTGSGTSFSSPLVAALVAGVWQRYPHLTNKQIIEAIRFSASQANLPDNELGYGVPHYVAVKNYLERSNQDELIAIFPNPVLQDKITIRPKNPEDIQQMSFSLVNIQGQLIQERVVDFNWHNSEYDADISTLSAGIYFLLVKAGEKLFTFRLVKL
jgi:serine protease AprX